MWDEIWNQLNKISVIIGIISFLFGNASGIFFYKKIINKNSNNINKNSSPINNHGTNNGIQIGNNSGDINVE